ncbi:MAG: NAD(P)H-quinone oxidoreductase [Pseudomonadales bacterium]
MTQLPERRQYIAINEDLTLSVAEEALPALKDDEVLIKVAGVGINRGDLLQVKGQYPPPADASPILGLEVSGEIIACGDAVTDWREGDAVCSLTHGAGYCNYTTVPASQLLAVPYGISLLEAAALPEALFTVWHNVFQRCQLKAGETLLVHGGSSGIGSLAIQMAKAMGAEVFVTAGSDEKCAFCIELGASKAVNYNTQDFLEELPAVDVILDMAGGDFIAKNIKLAAEDGRICSIAFARGFRAEINFIPVLMKRLMLTGSTLRAQSFEQKQVMASEIHDHILPAFADGRIKPVVDSVFDFSDAGKAHALMASGEHKGKILLEITH